MIVEFSISSPELLFAMIDYCANNIALEATNAAASRVAFAHVSISHLVFWLDEAINRTIVRLDII